MESPLVGWLISLISGGAGGNIVGALLKDKSLGPIVNSILGALGGAAGGQLLPQLLPQIIEMLGNNKIAGNAGMSAILGALLPLIASFLKPNAEGNKR